MRSCARQDPVIIAGAGPAGLSAALALARTGLAVEVHEKSERLGPRFSGDLHGVENWSSPTDFVDELRAMGVRTTFDCTPCTKVLFTNGGPLRVVQASRPFFYMVSRGSGAGCLEHSLLDQALAAGAKIFWRSSKRPEEVDIVATGPNPRERFCVGLGLTFSTSAADTAIGLVHERAAPRGYAYLLVRNGVGCLFAVLFEHFSKARECLDNARRLFERHVEFDVRNARVSGGFGSFRLDGRHVSGSTLQIGEAAGLQDFVWGFGIRTAMASGHLAARCWMSGLDYAEEGRRRFDSRHRASLIGRLVWEASAERAMPLYLKCLRERPDGLGALRFVYRERTIHRLLFPVALWWMRRRYPHLTEGEGRRAASRRVD